MSLAAVELAGVDSATFYTQLEFAFARAAAAADGPSTHCLRLGPGELQLHFAETELARRLLLPFAHLISSNSASPAFRFSVSIFAGTSGARLPPAPWSRADYDVRGWVAGFNDARWHTLIDPTRGILRVADRKMQRGVCFFPSLDEALRIGYTTPLISLLGGFFRDLPLSFVHAGAVGFSSGGVLITGRGGAGKSTTVAACVAAELGLAGDDLVLVDFAAQPAVYSVLETIKLDPAALNLLPALRPHATGTETLPCEKHVVWVRRAFADSLLPRFPLRAVLVPAISGQVDSQLSPMSPAEALRHLAPSTLQLLPGGDAQLFAKLGSLVRALPCFRLEAGTDLCQPPRLVRQLIERLS